MDSKAINKLIRSEVWPVLRRFGFSHFEARNAFAYKNLFINVVNFQSFNSYHAGSLGCTTYSFAVNLGTYVIGHPRQRHVRRDDSGRLLPLEYECSFRTHLRKRTAIDGFERGDIFYVDPDGRTTAACFNEVIQLVNELLPRWFDERNDLDLLLSRMDAVEPSTAPSQIDAEGVPGSYNWNTVKTLLLGLQHAKQPSQQSANRTIRSVDAMISNILDFSTIQAGRPGEERYAADVRELWDKLGPFQPTPVWATTEEANTSLLSPAWESSASSSEDRPLDFAAPVSARKEFWPLLKTAGFSEFTDRLAHRVSQDLIETVEFLPMDPYERKEGNHPANLFRIGLGVFWPALRKEGLFRTDRSGNARPVVNECHLSNWLAPGRPRSGLARTAFASANYATEAISKEGLGWLDLFREAKAAIDLLEKPNWQLFWRYPMMRGYGSRTSSRRLVYLAFLNLRIGHADHFHRYLDQADHTVPAFRGDWIRSWIAEVRARLPI